MKKYLLGAASGLVVLFGTGSVWADCKINGNVTFVQPGFSCSGSKVTNTAAGGGGTPGDPTATIDGSVHNGVATSYMRSDAAPPLSTTGVTPQLLVFRAV